MQTRDVRPDTEASPMEPLFEIGLCVEEARGALLRAVKLADAADLPAIHMRVSDARLSIERIESFLASWIGGEE